MQTTSDLYAEILKMAEGQVDNATRKSTIEISAHSLQYTRDALSSRVDEDSRWTIYQAGLPKVTKPPAPVHRALAEEDFEIGSDQSSSMCSPQPTDATLTKTVEQRIEAENVPHCMEVEPKDILHHLYTAIDNKTLHSDIPQPDEDMDNLFKLFTNCDADKNHCEATASIADEIPYSAILPSGKRQKLAHDFDAYQQTVTSPSSDPSFGSATLTTCDHDHFKLDLPDLQGTKIELPKFDVYFFLDTHPNKPVPRSEIPENMIEQLDRLPFEIPTMQNVLKDNKPENIAALNKYYDPHKSTAVVLSDKLLWKEPGLRILDNNDTDDEDLVAGDYDIGDWETQPSVPMEPGNVLESNGTYFFGRNSSSAKHESLSEELVHVSAIEKSMPPSEVETAVPTTIKLESGLTRSTEMSRRETTYCTIPSASVLRTSSLNACLSKHERNPRQAKSTKAQISVHQVQNRATKPPLDEGTGAAKGLLANDPLSDFLELRGKKFKFLPSKRISNNIETSDDPIQSTQNSNAADISQFGQCGTGQQIDESPQNEEIQQEVLPPIIPLQSSRTIVLNNSLLQSKPLLIQFLERQTQNDLSLIYRDLDDEQLCGPDMVLNTTTCLLITNLQALDQRPLPGSCTATGLSVTHDQTALLSQRFPKVIIMVHYLTSNDSNSHCKLASSLAAFAAFCQSLSQNANTVRRDVCAIHVPCTNPVSTSSAVNAWTWQIICQYGHTSITPTGMGTVPQAPSALIQDETLWELLLCKAGLNAMAAQVVIGSLKRPGMPSESPNGKDPSWGLRKLVAMPASKRSERFCRLIGTEAVDKLNKVLQN